MSIQLLLKQQTEKMLASEEAERLRGLARGLSCLGSFRGFMNCRDCGDLLCAADGVRFALQLRALGITAPDLRSEVLSWHSTCGSSSGNAGRDCAVLPRAEAFNTELHSNTHA